MTNAVITHFRRSPFHFATKGALAKTRPDDIAAQVISPSWSPIAVSKQLKTSKT